MITNQERILSDIDRLNQFELTLIRVDEILKHEVRGINAVPIADYVEHVDTQLKTIKNYIDSLVKSSHNDLFSRLSQIDEKVESYDWSKDILSNYPFNDLGNPFSFQQDLKLASKRYESIATEIKEKVWNVSDLNNWCSTGLTLKLSDNKLSDIYNLLVDESYVEEGMRSAFVRSLTGKGLIGCVKWNTAAHVNRFFRYLGAEKIEGDYVKGSGIRWVEIERVFYQNFKGAPMKGTNRSGSSDLEKNVKDPLDKILRTNV